MRNRTVFVVEADSSIRSLLNDILCSEGYRVHLQEPGVLSTERVVAAQPDLLLLELMPDTAPRILAVIEALQWRPATAAVPIIVSTTVPHLIEQHGATLRQLGCRALLKPFDLDCLLEMVSQQLTGKISC